MKKLERKKTLRNLLVAILVLLFISVLGLEKSIFLLVGILSINLILFIHELGHYLVVKAVKMPVYEFSVGVGPKLYSKEVKGVEYCIRCIPLGGYVVFENVSDEEDEDVLSEDSVDLYRSIHPLKRALVILAGPVFNFLLAFIVAIGIYMGQGFMSTTIGTVLENSPAQQYGLEAGDVVLSVNNTNINGWEDIIQITSQNEELVFKVDRNGKQEVINVKSELDKETNSYKIGISPQYKKDFLKSITRGVETTVYNIKATVNGYIQIVKDAFNKNKDENVELVGPIGTIQTVTESVQYGLESLMLMVFAMSISVGVFNLIPVIPNLDGGRLLFVFIEMLRGGKQFSRKTEENILVAGAYAMLALFLFVTLKDLIGIF